MSFHDVPPPTDETPAKRRKIRKGTSSCWECKRRKTRCTFASAQDGVCVGCQGRGTTCVSQEFPEIVAPSKRGRQMGNRIERVEAMIDRLVSGSGGEGVVVDGGDVGEAPTVFTRDDEPNRVLALIDGAVEEPVGANDGGPSVEVDQGPQGSGRAVPSGKSRYARLSQTLYDALPSKEDLDILWKAGAHASIHFHQVMMTPYPEMEKNDLDSSDTQDIPGPDTHPVLLAHYFFRITTVLQYLDPESHGQLKEMSESPRDMMNRLADTAISLVTTHDELLGTVEDLESVMMEGIYQANCGNLRRAWIAFRRAMGLAQLMGMHRAKCPPLKVIDPQAHRKFNAQLLWYRIVHADRFFCLMMGLPQGSQDRSMASEAALKNDTPIGRLERIHCAIASRILERNDSDPGSYSFSTTQEIDHQLQEAAKTMPSKWWLAPNLAAAASAAGTDKKAVFWEMLRLVNQLYHFNLLNQLHLPFMLRFTAAERRLDYSQTTCVNASREVLSRFISFRSFNRVAYCCRAVDFFALTAALILLLAHLDGHRRRHAPQAEDPQSTNGNTRGDLNFLAHQRLSDRAMMEQVVENMDQIGRVSMDAVSERSAGLLRRLLAMEADAAEGKPYSTQSERISDNPPEEQDELDVVRICIPYFGTVRVAREGVISKETPPGMWTPAIDPEVDAGRPLEHETGVNSDPLASVPHVPEIQSQFQAFDGIPQHEPMPTYVPQQRLVNEFYPGMTAGTDAWAFQGVDMAFFDSLMQGSMRDIPDWGEETILN
ncbi:hypothetical protein P170DRAFT_508005 [Aspergillus steynii IBT 23096]|uniref:Zn(2)-C6 fungal-type domain-containing protein n=1 Tax=Aspergillus steynii IBT 23096 TaxID=1392250 RepID=A0A2I2GKE8_9EURO|nr:uncharacterized protein P170DRAFT_508005 [Aspergillus steynii IBT 23096]PLB53363.1 hypothetical protein P170DRAFT_508005 [Aspergillus steynii IBT 23096]